MSVVVYGIKEGCPFCDLAKNKLEERGVPFEFVDVKDDQHLFRFFKSVHDTVPQIYEDGKHIGDSKAALTVGTPKGQVSGDFEW